MGEQCMVITAGSHPAARSEIILINVPTLPHILDCVCAHYDVSLTNLLSGCRETRFVRPRHVAMYLARQMTTNSTTQIAKAIGRRDHTSVLHAVRRIEEMIGTDARLAAEVGAIARKIRSTHPARLPACVLANDNEPAFQRNGVKRQYGFWTERRLKKLREMWADGATDLQCAKHFGVSQSYVRATVSKHNITRDWP